MADWKPEPILVTEVRAHKIDEIRNEWLSLVPLPAASLFIDGGAVENWAAAVAILADGEAHSIRAIVGERRPELFIPADEAFGDLSHE